MLIYYSFDVSHKENLTAQPVRKHICKTDPPESRDLPLSVYKKKLLFKIMCNEPQLADYFPS